MKESRRKNHIFEIIAIRRIVGRLIYHGRRLLKGAGYFGPPVEDLKELVHMDPKKDFAAEAQGCKEVKPSAKHRTRKAE